MIKLIDGFGLTELNANWSQLEVTLFETKYIIQYIFFRQKNNELNKIVSGYEDIVKTNYKITDAHQKLADGLIELLKKIEVRQFRFYRNNY